MSNRVLIPAFKAKVGDWKYYICTMKYATIDAQIKFAHELTESNTELEQLIQRGISQRTKDITDYLLNSEHRFLGSLIVAAWGGDPKYTPVEMQEDELLDGLDKDFGVLTFDGGQRYFALDGQHRVQAIKDALKKNPDLGKEDICVIMVTHLDTEEGRIRTRRLFSNINKNAVKTAEAENIALDEDDGFMIITRRLLRDHSFFNIDKRVKVIQRHTSSGELVLAKGNIPKTDLHAFTTIIVLYNCLKQLGWGLPSSMSVKTKRPSDKDLDQSYDTLASRFDDILKNCGKIDSLFDSGSSAKEIRAPKGNEGAGHPFTRPVVQKAVCKALRQVVNDGRYSWDQILNRLSKLKWELGAAPWTIVFNSENGRMEGSKERGECLAVLVRCHLGPRNKEDVKQARKEFKDLKGSIYPFKDESLFDNLSSQEIFNKEEEIVDDLYEDGN